MSTLMFSKQVQFSGIPSGKSYHASPQLVQYALHLYLPPQSARIETPKQLSVKPSLRADTPQQLKKVFVWDQELQGYRRVQ